MMIDKKVIVVLANMIKYTIGLPLCFLCSFIILFMMCEAVLFYLCLFNEDWLAEKIIYELLDDLLFIWKPVVV